jgi:hypothetical protein
MRASMPSSTRSRPTTKLGVRLVVVVERARGDGMVERREALRIDTMPSWIQGFAQHQPITPVIEILRGLLLGMPGGSIAWRALAWCGAILGVSIAVSGVLFRRRTAA